MGINYDGLVFAPAGEANSLLRGHYHQDDDLVWADFAGGKVLRGSLVGVCAPDGTLKLAYSQVLCDGTVIAGDCVSHPETLPDGRIRLTEQWRRHTPFHESGSSVIEEVPAFTS